MKWRAIGLEANDAYFNMAIDQAIMEELANKRTEPTIRFYTWLPSAVSIGRFQSMEGEVNTDACRDLDISYVRRITGGGAVYHDFKGEVTYSILAPQEYFPKGIRESYAFICKGIISALSSLGIESRFSPINDIMAYGKKISGNAQTRKEGILLQHGTVLYSLDVERMFNVLKVSKEKISDKEIKDVKERVTCVSDYANVSQKVLYARLLASFMEGKEHYMGKYTENEKSRARQLVEGVYGTDEWNFSR